MPSSAPAPLESHAVGDGRQLFPEGFGHGPGERDAVLALLGMQGTKPLDLYRLACRVGSATGCVRAVALGDAGSVNDRAFVAAFRPGPVREAMRRAGARLAVPGDPDYDPGLMRLADPPVGLFVRGEPVEAGSIRVAVIGARRPSPLGRDVARELGRGIAAAGVVVVSGGAVGVDIAAHRGALDAAGGTVAVLGSGIDVLYPQSNADVLRQIARNGTVISEYPPGLPAEPRRFPARNRLIAAMARGVVVVEGGVKSGTRITAEQALDIGIEVFAVPGPVTSPLAATPLILLREGARLIRGTVDLLDDLGIDRTDTPVTYRRGLPPEERRVFEALEITMLPEAVAGVAGLSVPHAVTALIGLEMRGLVRCSAGRYERTYRPALAVPADDHPAA